MMDIDAIMRLLDWHKSDDEQDEGVRMAEEINDLRIFLQPCGNSSGKRVWDNCARILSRRTDAELSAHLVELLEWLQDLNWPGALCILERLQNYMDTPSYHSAFQICLRRAQSSADEDWISNLNLLQSKRTHS